MTIIAAKLIKKQRTYPFRISFYYLCNINKEYITYKTIQLYETEEIHLAGTRNPYTLV